MNAVDLTPAPTNKRPFRRNHQKFVPDRSGCYALSTFIGVVLYVLLMALTLLLWRRSRAEEED